MKKCFLLLLCLAGLVSFVTACGATKSDEDIYLTLVNKSHQLPADWESKITLVKSEDPWGDEVTIEEETFKQFEKLQKDLLEQGVDIRLDSVYRSVDEQIELWRYFEEQYGEEYCKKYVAIPGFSEHHTGMAVDVCMIVNGEADNDNDHMIAAVNLFDKVHATMPKYGFILRYPEGKKDVTGYSYEPWHLRYVGSPEVAEEITERGVTLEEYLGET